MDLSIDKQTGLIIGVGAIVAALIFAKPDLLFGAKECDCTQTAATCPDLTSEQQNTASAGVINIQHPPKLKV